MVLLRVMCSLVPSSFHSQVKGLATPIFLYNPDVVFRFHMNFPGCRKQPTSRQRVGPGGL